MDGLLLDTERIAWGAMREAVALQGETLADESFLAMVGRGVDGTLAVLHEAFGADFPAQAVHDRFRTIYLKRIHDDGIPLKAGVTELLTTLESNSVPCAVATSTRYETAIAKLNLTGIDHFFDAIVGGDQIARSKPAPDIYLAAARMLNVAAADCLALEDSDPGIAAAHAAGMTAWMVPDLKAPSAQSRAKAARIFASLIDVRQALMETP